MVFLIMWVFTLFAVYQLGLGAGEVKERQRHERAVDEATKKIASMDEWRGR